MTVMVLLAAVSCGPAPDEESLDDREGAQSEGAKAAGKEGEGEAEGEGQEENVSDAADAPEEDDSGCLDYGDGESCARAGCGWKGSCVASCSVDVASAACVASCESVSDCAQGPELCAQCCGTCTRDADCGGGNVCTATRAEAPQCLPSCDAATDGCTGHCVRTTVELENCDGCLTHDDCDADQVCEIEDVCECWMADSDLCGGTCTSDYSGGAEGEGEAEAEAEGEGEPVTDATCCLDEASGTCVDDCAPYDSASCLCSKDACAICRD